MITLEHVVAMSITHRTVLDQLSESLLSELVLVNPFYRRIVEFADSFSLKYRKLPGIGDWELWIQSLATGMIQNGTKESLGRLLALDLSTFEPEYFGPHALAELQRGAVVVALSRLNEIQQLTPETFTLLAEQIAKVEASSVQGLATLSDIDTWAPPIRQDDIIPTGFPKLDELMGGWGKELWIIFADSGKGKSMLLQNFLANATRRGKRGLHITLELGIRSQIQRYYRQVSQSPRGDFYTKLDDVKKRLHHWFKFAAGEIMLLEFPAYGLDPDTLARTIERVNRIAGDIDILGLDYLDLMTLPKQHRVGQAYADLGRLTHDVRSLCARFDITVLTASQAIRRPANSDHLTQRDMGDSYKKVQGADGLISLVQTTDEKEVWQARLGLEKVRDSGGRGEEIPLYMNTELAIIQDLDHPNTVQLMQRLGHLNLVPSSSKGGATHK